MWAFKLDSVLSVSLMQKGLRRESLQVEGTGMNTGEAVILPWPGAN